MLFVLTVTVIFVLLVCSEIWWRTRRPKDEFSRKFIHIAVGSFAAFWPFYLSWNQILLLSAAFVVVVSVSKSLRIFQAIHSVERPTWGEVFFALAVGLLALITHDHWIYAAALLHMSLADGLAAITGVTWGQRTRYKVLGHPKSLVGSATFFVISLVILAGYVAVTDRPLAIGMMVTLALASTAVENFGLEGLDNLCVPLLVGVILNHLA